jgi:hypothetical protein
MANKATEPFVLDFPDGQRVEDILKKADADYSKAEINAALGGKVDKETGKGLSTNDYTNAEKTKLAGIEKQANRTTVDDVLSDVSTNPVQNKVVKAALASKADSADIPAVPITAIQKNGADITPVGGTVDIIVPTTAEDVGALPDTTKYAAALSLTIDSSTFVVTGQLKDQNGDNLGTAQTIDLPLESVVVGGSYDNITKKVVLMLQNGNTVEFSVADLVAGLQSELSETNKLNPTYIEYDSSHRAVSDSEKAAWNAKQKALTTEQLAAVNSGITSESVAQIVTNKNNISSIQQEQIVQNNEIATLREITNCKLYGFKIDKQDVNPDTRVTYLYDAIGMTPAYMDFNSGSFNYGSWADIWFIKNNRPVALKFDGTVDYELDHTDFTKKLDGTASDVENVSYAGNFMSEMPLIYVKRWEDSRYNYIVFSETKPNDDYLAQAHTNANGTVNPYIYLPMFKGWKDSNSKLRSLMGTYPTENTTGTNEVTYAGNCGTGWQLWDKAKIDLIMDLIVLITKSTSCRAKIGNGDCQTYNTSDTTSHGKMKSGYETDSTTRSASAQFYGSEGTEVTNYGKHHMIAFYIEDLWGNRWDRCLGFNRINNAYKVKMVAPYTLDSDSSYETLTVAPPSNTEGWLKNVSSANAYGDVPTEVGASTTTGFANYFYRNAGGSYLSLFGGYCNDGLRVGRYWSLDNGSGSSNGRIGGSPCYNNPS